ncbi:MAG: sodium pump decarboxylase, gamma subunit [Lachnospiraceae bacterium]|nr:sodium pump decarboxylase, gamma subunit [Lachnospiraceae bacterium]
MKRNMKKLLGLLVLLTLAFTLSACAEQQKVPNEEIYQEKSDRYVETISSMTAEELAAQVSNLEENFEDFEQEVSLYPYIYGQGKFDFTAEAYMSLLKSFEANQEDLGAYVQLKEYEGGTEKDGEISYSAVYEFEKHDLRLTLLYDKNNVITTVTADPIYTTGEILEKAALNTVLGMGVVFAVLILICLIISCFGFIPAIEAKFSGKKKEAAPAAAPAAVPAAAPLAPVVEETDDLALIAVVTAAVAASLGTSTDGFVVRSIKRKSNNKWKR